MTGHRRRQDKTAAQRPRKPAPFGGGAPLAEGKIEAARAYSESIINTIRQPLLVFDDELRVLSGNHAFYRSFALTPEQAVGQRLGAGGNTHTEVPGLRGLLDRVKTEPAPIEDYEIEVELPLLGRRVLLLNARKIHDGLLGQAKILEAEGSIVRVMGITSPKCATTQFVANMPRGAIFHFAVPVHPDTAS